MLVWGNDKNRSTPSNCMPSTSACCRQVQHGFEVNERFRVWSLADEPGPHRVVDCRVLVLIAVLTIPRFISATAAVRQDYPARSA